MTGQRPRRPLVRPVLGLVGLLAAALVGTAATVLTARWVSQPGWFLAVGFAAAATTAFAVAGLTLPPHRRGFGVGTTIAALAAAALGAAWLIPLRDPPPAPLPDDVRYWELPSGSRLAHLDVPAVDGHARRAPVVVLHGGPGISDLTGDAAFWGQLSRLGFHVYVYAQLGAGPSTRLADPAGYQVGRDVSDLEQVRLRIGADRLILVGHSYGGYLAAAYLAAHPSHVERLVLSSPGPLDPADHSGAQATARLTLSRRVGLYRSALQPRALLGYLLLQVNPAAAHAFLPDAEADARNDTLLTQAAPGLHCTAANRPRTSGSGFYRLQYPQSAGAPPPADLRPQLAGRTASALILKGRCDYLSWASATDYRRLLAHSSLVYLPDAGHSTYQDDPDTVLAVTTAFLEGQPLPVAPYQGLDPPADYQSR